jgi:hypothetical protein
MYIEVSSHMHTPPKLVPGSKTNCSAAGLLKLQFPIHSKNVKSYSKLMKENKYTDTRICQQDTHTSLQHVLQSCCICMSSTNILRLKMLKLAMNIIPLCSRHVGISRMSRARPHKVHTYVDQSTFLLFLFCNPLNEQKTV